MPRSKEILYFNGLERTGVGRPERTLINYLRFRGITMNHAEVAWHSDLPYQKIFETAMNRAEELLQKSEYLTLVGASAGGSLAVNVFHALSQRYPAAELRAVSLSGRLKVANLDTFSRSVMARPNPSQSFIDSVIACDYNTLPQLSQHQKSRMLTVQPLADEAIPLSTMGIEGVQNQTVPIAGHVAGIALAALMLPRTLKTLQRQGHTKAEEV